MKYLIDTNILIYYFNGSLSAPAKEKITFANVLPLSESIVERTIQLKQTAKIKLPDAIIGATALCHNLNLVTHNVKDFVGIDLVLSDPCD